MASPMTVQCPSCETTFPVDPAKVPEGGVRTQCTVCQTMFRVDRPAEDLPAPSGAPAWAGETEGPQDVGVAAGVQAPEDPGVEGAPPEPMDEVGDLQVEEGVADDHGGEALDVELADESPLAAGEPDPSEGERDDAGLAEMEAALAEFEAAAETASEAEPGGTEGEVPEEGFADDGSQAPGGGEATVTEFGEDWVVETQEPVTFDDVEVERLETVEESLRAAAHEAAGDEPGPEGDDELEGEESPFSGFSAAGEIMLTESDLDRAVGEAVPEAEAESAEELPEGPPGSFDVEPGDGEKESWFGGQLVEEPAGDVADGEPTHDEPGPADVEPGMVEVDGDEGDEGEPGVDGPPADVAEAPLDADLMEDLDVAFEPEAEVEAPSETVVDQAPEEVEPPPSPGAFVFGRRDPHDKARRLARVLVSDMITYNPERHALALERDTLAEDFEEEIEKSWAEYVEQVGTELAESTRYWTDALNEILARGEPLF